MKRLAACAWLALVLVAVLSARAPATQHAQQTGGHGGDHTTLWKVANFVLLAGGLGYLISKKGGAFFRARTQQIQKDMAEAARVKEEAQARYVQIEQRLAGLEVEIKNLRRSAREEAATESGRVGLDVQRELEKIQAQAEQEIASATNAACQQLRAFSAELAIRLAEQKIRGWMTAEIGEQLVVSAIEHLGRVGSQRPGLGGLT